MHTFYHRLEHFSFLVEQRTLFSRIESQNLRLDQEGRVASRLEFHGAGKGLRKQIEDSSFLSPSRCLCRRNTFTRGREEGGWARRSNGHVLVTILLGYQMSLHRCGAKVCDFVLSREARI